MIGEYQSAISEMISRHRIAIERRAEWRRHRRMLAETDALVGELERLNLVGQGGQQLEDRLARHIDQVLAGLPAAASRRYPGGRTNLQALDGIFAVQEEVLRRIQALMGCGGLFDNASAA